MIGVGFGQQARDLLEQGGLPVEYHEHAGGHAIHPDHVAAARLWLGARVLLASPRQTGRAGSRTSW